MTFTNQTSSPNLYYKFFEIERAVRYGRCEMQSIRELPLRPLGEALAKPSALLTKCLPNVVNSNNILNFKTNFYTSSAIHYLRLAAIANSDALSSRKAMRSGGAGVHLAASEAMAALL
eukprot:1339483-Pleurochrysis_carterae.AAC.1